MNSSNEQNNQNPIPNSKFQITDLDFNKIKEFMYDDCY